MRAAIFSDALSGVRRTDRLLARANARGWRETTAERRRMYMAKRTNERNNRRLFSEAERLKLFSRERKLLLALDLSTPDRPIQSRGLTSSSRDWKSDSCYYNRLWGVWLSLYRVGHLHVQCITTTSSYKVSNWQLAINNTAHEYT